MSSRAGSEEIVPGVVPIRCCHHSRHGKISRQGKGEKRGDEDPREAIVTASNRLLACPMHVLL